MLEQLSAFCWHLRSELPFVSGPSSSVASLFVPTHRFQILHALGISPCNLYASVVLCLVVMYS